MTPFLGLIEVHVSQPFQKGLIPSPWFYSVCRVAHQTDIGTWTNWTVHTLDIQRTWVLCRSFDDEN